MHKRKQMKITQILFGKDEILPTTNEIEVCNKLLEEVQELEKRFQEKHNEFFQIHRKNCRKKALPQKKKEENTDKPQKIILKVAVEVLKRKMELMSMLTGVEVQEYVANDHCCLLYHMQCVAGPVHTHGLRINMQTDGNKVCKSSMPLGFNLEAILEEFSNIMQSSCLGAIRRALVAYYDRLEQYEALKKLLNINAELFKLLDSSLIEISFFAETADEEDEHLRITLTLNYRLYDIRPKTYSFKENELPEDVTEVLREQCAVFKRKPLRKAFKRVFMNDIGPYRLIHRLGPRYEKQKQKHPKRFRPNKNNYNNDDTFLPEDCSDQSDEEVLSE